MEIKKYLFWLLRVSTGVAGAAPSQHFLSQYGASGSRGSEWCFHRIRTFFLGSEPSWMCSIINIKLVSPWKNVVRKSKVLIRFFVLIQNCPDKLDTANNLTRLRYAVLTPSLHCIYKTNYILDLVNWLKECWLPCFCSSEIYGEWEKHIPPRSGAQWRS